MNIRLFWDFLTRVDGMEKHVKFGSEEEEKTVDDNVIVNSRMHSSGSFFGKEKRNFQEFKVELNLFSSYAY